MSHDDHPSFNANHVFIALFVFTALEVGWSYIPGLNKFFLWGGLLFFAFLKGLLIFMYFMHMKFEGWVVKCLIAPTPILVAVVVFTLMPDVAKNSRMDHSITDMVDPTTGEIVTIGSRDGALDEEHGAEDGGGH